MDKKKLFNDASDAFIKKEYTRALDLFMRMLRLDPGDKQGKMGVMLCDLVNDNEEEATLLFDYYLVLLNEKEEDPEEQIIEMIEAFDSVENEIHEMVAPALSQIIAEGITYEDFKSFVKERGDFKKAYEDIMFSTKVVITKKEDLFDFVNSLIENGYKDQAYRYIEDASKLYPTDRELVRIFQKLKHDI